MFVYTTSVALPKGTKMKFDLMSNGRDLDWELPTSNLKKTKNVIFAKLDNDKILQAKEIETPDSIYPLFEFIVPEAMPLGSNFTVVVGSPKSDESTFKTHGTRAQTNTQRRRSFQLYIDPTGKGRYDEAEVFSMDVRGGELSNIRVLTPSFVARNKRFDVIVRFEDQYGNLTSEAHEDTLVELSYENLRENLKWKLFVPETGFISLPNLYFNEAGIYTICLENLRTKEVFRSPPIKCFPDNTRHLFWGLLHGESERIDSTENIESCLRHFRDERALNFYASSSFESQEETSSEIWKLIIQNLTEFDETDRFTTLVGFQFSGEPTKEGTRQLVYGKENKTLLRKKDPKYTHLSKIYKCFAPKELISIPTFTMGKGFDYDFKNFDPEYERVVEIYNAWGSSECTKKEGNTKPITGSTKNGITESAEGSIQKALLRNCRFGFVAGGLDDRGIYTDFFEGDQFQYSPGMTAIISLEHSRSAMMEALYNRSCYATTGERIIVGLYLAGLPMGSETSTAVKHGLVVNRHLSGYVAGTTILSKVEIIRNAKVIKTFECSEYSMNFTYDDMTPLERIVVDAKDKKPPFAYYYVRVTQADGHMAWSSPIWVDYVPLVLKKPDKKPAVLKPISKDDFLEDFDVDLDDELEDEFDEDFTDIEDDK
jgi:hypothetical protein